MTIAITTMAWHLWTWLPYITVALRFVTALISFALVCWTLIRRIRHGRRP